MVIGQVDNLRAVVGARGLVAAAVAQGREAHDLVERDPVLDPVTERTYDRIGVRAERLGHDPRPPAAAVLQRLRQIPVKERHPRRDLLGEHRVDQTVVEVEPLLVERAVTRRKDPRPRHREAVVAHPQLAHEPEVFLVAVVVIAGHIRSVAAQHPAGLARETVPDRLALAVLEGRALDLRGGGRHAPDEVLREGQGRTLRHGSRL